MSKTSKNIRKAEREVQEKLGAITVWQFSEIKPSEGEIISRFALKQRKTMKTSKKPLEASLSIIGAEIQVESAEVKKMEENVAKHSEYIAKLQRQRQELEAELEKIKHKIRLVTGNLNVAQGYHADIENALDNTKQHLEVRRSNFIKMNTIYLIHPTASMKMIYENQLGTFVITETDEPFCSGIYADKKFKIDSDESSLITNIPADFYAYYKHEEERKSIIDYCEMVAYYMMIADTEQEVVPLYANEYIHKILVANGIIE